MCCILLPWANLQIEPTTWQKHHSILVLSFFQVNCCNSQQPCQWNPQPWQCHESTKHLTCKPVEHTTRQRNESKHILFGVLLFHSWLLQTTVIRALESTTQRHHESTRIPFLVMAALWDPQFDDGTKALYIFLVSFFFTADCCYQKHRSCHWNPQCNEGTKAPYFFNMQATNTSSLPLTCLLQPTATFLSLLPLRDCNFILGYLDHFFLVSAMWTNFLYIPHVGLLTIFFLHLLQNLFFLKN